MKKMRGRVIAHDVMAAFQVHFSQTFIADFRLTRNHFADVDDDACRGAAHGGDFDLPALSPSGSPRILRIQGERFYVTRIINLPAGFDVKTGLWQNDLDLIAERSGVNRLSIHN